MIYLVECVVESKAFTVFVSNQGMFAISLAQGSITLNFSFKVKGIEKCLSTTNSNSRTITAIKGLFSKGSRNRKPFQVKDNTQWALEIRGNVRYTEEGYYKSLYHFKAV